MNSKEAVEKWIAALRSGKYAQGNGFARSIVAGQDRYCCLGVLADAVGETPCVGAVMPSPKVLEYVRVGTGLSPWAFVALNDMHRSTFDEIADVIGSAIRNVESGVIMPGLIRPYRSTVSAEKYIEYILSASGGDDKK